MYAHIVNRQNVRMIQGAGGLRFLFKSPETISVLRESGGQNFDRHVAIQLFIARAIDLTHPARAELRADFVTTELCADWNHVKYFSDQRRACPRTGRTWQTQVRKLAPDCLVDLARGAHA